MPARDIIRYTLFKVTSIDELDAGTSSCNDSETALTNPIEYFKHFKGFPSSAICPSRVRHGGHFYHSIYIILCVCSFLEHSSDPSMKSTCAEPHMSLVLMTDVISEDSGEHVCLQNLVRVSFTNKV